MKSIIELSTVEMDVSERRRRIEKPGTKVPFQRQVKIFMAFGAGKDWPGSIILSSIIDPGFQCLDLNGAQIAGS